MFYRLIDKYDCPMSFLMFNSEEEFFGYECSERLNRSNWRLKDLEISICPPYIYLNFISTKLNNITEAEAELKKQFAQFVLRHREVFGFYEKLRCYNRKPVDTRYQKEIKESTDEKILAIEQHIANEEIAVKRKEMIETGLPRLQIMIKIRELTKTVPTTIEDLVNFPFQIIERRSAPDAIDYIVCFNCKDA